MPKATFFNLNESKKKKILDAAIEAFSTEEYELVTVSNLVKDAGIAKGSFYQYFEDKFDLYQYIVQMAGEIKKQYFIPVFQKMAESNFFDLLSDMYKAGLKFSVENKKMSDIGMMLVKSSNKDVYNKIYAGMSEQVEDFMSPLIQTAITKGEVREDIDISFISYVFGQFNMVMADYYFTVQKKEGIEGYVDSIDMMIDLFKHGVENK